MELYDEIRLNLRFHIIILAYLFFLYNINYLFFILCNFNLIYFLKL